METVGIISEFNPFHRGHEALLREIRRQGARTIICAMSGNYVQRGDVAVTDKLVRAEMAVRCGADLILELPTLWSMTTAETFARGGVAILSRAECDTLAFGSECGDAAALLRAANALERPDFAERLRAKLSQGGTFAAARQQTLEQLLGQEAALLTSPNNTLGVEYLRAIRHGGAEMTPLTIRRIGAVHDGSVAEGIASGSCLRKLLSRGDETAYAYLPAPAAELLRREIAAGRAPVELRYCERAILSRLRQLSEEEFAPYDGGREGLYHRFYEAVQDANSMEALLTAAKTKRYPMARLRRMMAAAWLGVPRAPVSIPYLRVLAANEQGRRHLRKLHRTGAPVLTKPADVGKLGREAERLFRLEAAFTDQYELCRPTAGKSGAEWRGTPRML